MKRLNNPDEPIARLFSYARVLGQTQSSCQAFHRDVAMRLNSAIGVGIRGRFSDLLARYGVTYCLHDMAGSATGPLVVGPFVYLRLPGPAR